MSERFEKNEGDEESPERRQWLDGVGKALKLGTVSAVTHVVSEGVAAEADARSGSIESTIVRDGGFKFNALRRTRKEDGSVWYLPEFEQSGNAAEDGYLLIRPWENVSQKIADISCTDHRVLKGVPEGKWDIYEHNARANYRDQDGNLVTNGPVKVLGWRVDPKKDKSGGLFRRKR